MFLYLLLHKVFFNSNGLFVIHFLGECSQAENKLNQYQNPGLRPMITSSISRLPISLCGRSALLTTATKIEASLATSFPECYF